MRGNTVVDDLSLAIQKRECNKIIKKVRSGNLRLAKFPSYTSCMRIFTKDIKPLKLLKLEQSRSRIIAGLFHSKHNPP